MFITIFEVSHVMKVGILTYHRSVNHGAFLQAYCLAKSMQKYLEKTAKVEVIDYTSKKAYQLDLKVVFRGNNIKDIYERFIRWYKFREAAKRLPLSKDKLISDDLEQVKEFINKQAYDIIIVGSDEVWKTTSVRGFPNAYWLNFPICNAIKVTYAVSSRSKLNQMPKQDREYVKMAIKNFDLLGIRDDTTANEIYKLTYEKYIMCCDPTFTIQLKIERDICKKILRKKLNVPRSKKLMGVMLAHEEIVEKLRKEFGEEYFIVSLFEHLNAVNSNYIAISPFEFVRIVAGLDCFITTRFHGAVFAIKENVPFLAIDDYDCYERSRLRFLLQENGLDNHLLMYNKHRNFADIVCRKFKECIDDKRYNQLAYKAVKNEKCKFAHYIEQLEKIMEEKNVSRNWR